MFFGVASRAVAPASYTPASQASDLNDVDRDVQKGKDNLETSVDKAASQVRENMADSKTHEVKKLYDSLEHDDIPENFWK